MSVFAVIADGELDQICGSKVEATKEKRDLLKMGCEVKVKEFDSEDKAYQWCDAKGVHH